MIKLLENEVELKCLKKDVEIIKSFNSLIEKYKDYDTIVSELNIDNFESYMTSGSKKSYNNGIISLS